MAELNNSTTVQTGDWVEVCGLAPDGSEVFLLVDDEGHRSSATNRIAASSLLGRLLIGRSVGETVSFPSPGGSVRITIVDRVRTESADYKNDTTGDDVPTVLESWRIGGGCEDSMTLAGFHRWGKWVVCAGFIEGSLEHPQVFVAHDAAKVWFGGTSERLTLKLFRKKTNALINGGKQRSEGRSQRSVDPGPPAAVPAPKPADRKSD